MKAKRMLIAYLLCVFPIVAICFNLIISGKVALFYSGFAIDSSDVLYVGTDAKIQKFYDGELIGTISPKTTRGYAFTIQKNDTILLSTASSVYIMDLSGNVIDKHEDIDTKIFNELQKSKNTFTSQSNREYVMKSQLGRTTIYSEKDIIYQMPMMDYIIKILFFAAIISTFVVVPIIIRQWKK